MGDFSMTMIRGEFDRQQEEADRAAAKTMKAALRGIARRTAAAAKPHAPVYKGDSVNKDGKHYVDHRAELESGNLRKSIRGAKKIKEFHGEYELKVAPIGKKTKTMDSRVVRYKNVTRGNTLESIKAARESAGGMGERSTMATRKKKAKQGNSSAGSVRGVQLYRSKIEDRTHYMAAGWAEADHSAEGTAQVEFDKAFERFH